MVSEMAKKTKAEATQEQSGSLYADLVRETIDGLRQRVQELRNHPDHVHEANVVEDACSYLDRAAELLDRHANESAPTDLES